MRFPLLVSLLFLPAVAAAECPVWERVFPPRIDCREGMPELSGAEWKVLEGAVQDHAERIGLEVGDAWRNEVAETFDDLPPDLKRDEVMEYIACMDYKEGRVCKDRWESRELCLVESDGRLAMEFPAGAHVRVEVASTQGVTFRGATRTLPDRARVETSGGLVFDHGRLRWRTGYTSGSAMIVVPESAGRWTLGFDEIATHEDMAWLRHAVDYTTGSSPPHEIRLRPDSHMSIDWSCPKQ